MMECCCFDLIRFELKAAVLFLFFSTSFVDHSLSNQRIDQTSYSVLVELCSDDVVLSYGT